MNSTKFVSISVVTETILNIVDSDRNTAIHVATFSIRENVVVFRSEYESTQTPRKITLDVVSTIDSIRVMKALFKTGVESNYPQ